MTSEAKPIIDVGVLYKEDFYFILTNSNAIYVKRKDGVIEKLQDGIFRTNGLIKFGRAILHNEYIWLIPQYEKSIYVYSIRENSVEEILIEDIIEDKGPDYPKCRDALIINNEIWVLSSSSRCLIKINLKTYEKTKIDLNIHELIYEVDSNVDFKNMVYESGNIFLFSDDCTNNICIDVKTLKINILNCKFRKKYANIINSKIILAPTTKNDYIEYIEYDGNVVNRVAVPENFWGNSDTSEFWNIRKGLRKTYICPHDARCIIEIDNETENICFTDISKLFEKPEANEIIEVDGGYLVLGESQSIVAHVSVDGEVSCWFYPEIEVQSLIHNYEGMYSESSNEDLEFFIEEIRQKK